MKKIFRYILIAVVAFIATGCDSDAIDPLTGIYPAPENYTMTTAQDLGVEKQGNIRIFNVLFTDKDNNTLRMKMAGDSYFLPAAAFTPADKDQLRKGNYAMQESTFTPAGGSAQGILKGNLTTTRNDNDYSLSGSLWLADGKVIKVTGNVTLVYEPDPEALKLTQVLSVTNNVPNGTNSITLNIATDGVTSTPNVWGGVDMGGSGNYLAVDFYSVDGTLQAGTYSAADANAMTEFTYGMGWDPGDLWGIGIEFSNWGTCWWTVENGQTSAQHITEGDIEVKQSGNIYTITYNHNGLFFEYKGEIEGLGAGQGGPQSYDITLTKVLSATNNVPNGTKTITLNLGTDGITPTPNAWGGVDMGGSGNYLAVDLYSEDGTLAAGTYTPTASGSEAPFTYVKGWDPGDLWGMGIEFTNWGTCWWTVDNGQASAQHIEDGDITVEYDGTEFTISYSGAVCSFQFKGAIEGVEGTGASSGEQPGGAEYIEISNFLSATKNDGNILSLQLATDGITLQPNMWGGQDVSGDGNYLKIDLYSEDGSIAEGTYEPVDNTALAPMTFAKGYDPGDIWGMGIEFKNWGTAWMSREGGNESGVNVTDGTIKVEKQGADYVITLTSSAANVRYTGPITL